MNNRTEFYNKYNEIKTKLEEVERLDSIVEDYKDVLKNFKLTDEGYKEIEKKMYETIVETANILCWVMEVEIKLPNEMKKAELDDELDVDFKNDFIPKFNVGERVAKRNQFFSKHLSEHLITSLYKDDITGEFKYKLEGIYYLVDGKDLLPRIKEQQY